MENEKPIPPQTGRSLTSQEFIDAILTLNPVPKTEIPILTEEDGEPMTLEELAEDVTPEN